MYLLSGTGTLDKIERIAKTAVPEVIRTGGTADGSGRESLESESCRTCNKSTSQARPSYCGPLLSSGDAAAGQTVQRKPNKRVPRTFPQVAERNPNSPIGNYSVSYW